MQDSATDDTAALQRIRDLVRWGASEFARAGLSFGHGAATPLDEAWHLTCIALHLPFELPESWLDSAVTTSERDAVLALFRQRVQTRKPAAYLTGRAWFCGLEFEVNEQVLVPRSPIAELLDRGLSPWLLEPPTQILDLCTGCGCIGIAAALHFPDAAVDLVDLSEEALAVCRRNVERYALGDRVSVYQGDLYGAIGDACYDLILSNPPYVPAAECEALPDEYRHEPRLGLDGGDDGMDLVERIVREAPGHLSDDGILVCEVGAYIDEFVQRFPRLPVTWADLDRGGEGVFIISRRDLVRSLS